MSPAKALLSTNITNSVLIQSLFVNILYFEDISSSLAEPSPLIQSNIF